MAHDPRWEQGKRCYPGVALEEPAFRAHVARLSQAGDHPDLYLACACLQRQQKALELLEETVWSQVPLFLSPLRPTSDQVEEITQQLRERTLVGHGTLGPRLGEYNGQGPLGAWVRMAALRLGLDVLGATARDRPLEEAPALATPVDSELAYVRTRYRDHYQDALRDALARLSAKERALLRFSVVDGLGIDALARIYSVHRATAARWLVGARERLLEETYGLLGERLRVPASELRSLAALVRSELHLSLGRLL